MFFGRKRQMLPGAGQNPQYYEVHPSDRPAADNFVPQGQSRMGQEGEQHPSLRIPEVVTSGFYEDEDHQFHLSYGLRPQPDIGGALNYAYENYGLPLNNVAGPWMVARWPLPPIGSRPLGFYQTAPITSIGGLVPGQIISQPLLNPYDMGSGYDIYD